MPLSGADDRQPIRFWHRGLRATGSLRRRVVQIVARVVQIRCPSRLTCPLMSDEASIPAALGG